jgi:hypothetical protein
LGVLWGYRGEIVAPTKRNTKQRNKVQRKQKREKKLKINEK